MPDGPRRFPVLWQVNARTMVRRLGDGATLDDLDAAVLDRIVPGQVDWVYLLGVWQTGTAGRAVSRQDPVIRHDCEQALPDLTDDDICGSCFAVTGYRVHERLGGDAALARLRGRLADRGVRLMLDFVPNHTAPDHPWVHEHPEFYVEGTDDDLTAAPGNWTRVNAGGRSRVLAYGRDPNFATGWPDTLQLDYSSPDVQRAMVEQLRRAASHGDGLRCDMAMLLLPDVFERTWGRTVPPFWPDALAAVRAGQPGCTFMAEVYWNRERDLQQQRFDVTYDKPLYDRLVGDLGGVRGHLCAAADCQARSARFLENHDERRAAAVFGSGDRQRSAAVVTYLCPGLRFFEDGQREGHRIHVPVHLCRAPVETDDLELPAFYAALLSVLGEATVHDGDWRLLDVTSAWDGNDSHADLLTSSWTDPDGRLRFVTVVNLADHRSQGYVQLAHPGLAGCAVAVANRLGPERYERDGDDLVGRGLYVDVGPWAHEVFEVDARPGG